MTDDEAMALRTFPSRFKPAQQSRIKPPPKKAESFYLSKEWRELRAEVIAERGRRCEVCGKTCEDDGGDVSLTLDHTTERRDGGANLDKRNLKLLCTKAGGNGAGGLGGCNNRKTARSRRVRLGGPQMVETGVDGWPIDRPDPQLSRA